MKRCMIVLFMHRNDRFEELARDDSLVRKFEEVPSILNGVEPLMNLDVETPPARTERDHPLLSSECGNSFKCSGLARTSHSQKRA